MKLTDIDNLEELYRPESTSYHVDDGMYTGTIVKAELVEEDSKYSDDGKRVALDLTVQVNYDGGTVNLIKSCNYSWSPKGNMLKTLEDLKMLPEPGSRLTIQGFVGMKVQAIVENVEKDGKTYSNMVSLKRLQKKQQPSS